MRKTRTTLVTSCYRILTTYNTTNEIILPELPHPPPSSVAPVISSPPPPSSFAGETVAVGSVGNVFSILHKHKQNGGAKDNERVSRTCYVITRVEAEEEEWMASESAEKRNRKTTTTEDSTVALLAGGGDAPAGHGTCRKGYPFNSACNPLR